MTEPLQLPEGMTLVRTTAEWDESSVPDGLLRTHRIAAGVWGLLQVSAGSLRLVFEDDGAVHTVHADEQVAIPPGRPHHVTLDGHVRFVIGFHRPATDAPSPPTAC